MYFTHIVFGRFNDVIVKLKFSHSSTFTIYPGVDELFLLFAEFYISRKHIIFTTLKTSRDINSNDNQK